MIESDVQSATLVGPRSHVVFGGKPIKMKQETPALPAGADFTSAMVLTLTYQSLSLRVWESCLLAVDLWSSGEILLVFGIRHFKRTQSCHAYLQSNTRIDILSVIRHLDYNVCEIAVMIVLSLCRIKFVIHAHAHICAQKWNGESRVHPCYLYTDPIRMWDALRQVQIYISHICASIHM